MPGLVGEQSHRDLEARLYGIDDQLAPGALVRP
jgi:hypothetical protein